MSMAILSAKPDWGTNYGPGWIGFCGEDSSFVSHGIAYLTRDGAEVKVSHVLVVTGENECVEALNQGVVRSPLRPYFESPRPIYFKRFAGYTPERGKQVALNAGLLVGLPYGFASIASDALAGSLTGRVLNGVFNWLSTETKNRWLANLPNRAVSKLANWDGLHPVCSVVAAEALHPVEERVLERGLVDVLGAVGCLECPRVVTPQMLFDDRAVFGD